MKIRLGRRLLVFRWPRVWVVREGGLLPPPQTHAELDTYVEGALDSLLFRADLVVITMEALLTMADRCDLEVVDAMLGLARVRRVLGERDEALEAEAGAILDGLGIRAVPAVPTFSFEPVA